MNITLLFGLLGGLLVLAFVANWQFHRTRVPDVLILLGVGILLGPGLGWVDAAKFAPVTHAFGTLAIILILFEGGLELNLRETLGHFPGGLALSIISFVLSLGAVASVLHWGMSLSWGTALLAGAVLGCTSSSIVLPVLQQMKLSDSLRVPLLLEASMGDVFAVLTVAVLLDAAAGGGGIIGSLVGGFTWKMLVSVALAVLTGLIWSRLLPKLSEERFRSVLTLAFVLLLFASTETVGGSGFIAVLGFGLSLANLPGVNPRVLDVAIDLDAPAVDHHAQVLTFHSELAFLVRTFFFVLLGVVVQFSGPVGYLFATAGILGMLFVARWLSIKVTDRAWRRVEPRERELLLWIMPRGLITAVLAIQVLEARGETMAFLPSLAFAVILLTNLIVVFGSIRAKRHQAATTDATLQGAGTDPGLAP